VILI
jgi:hypothetical protein